VPAEAEEWSLATLHERLVKTGARIVFAEISVGLTCSGPLPSAWSIESKGQKVRP
jgi:hypothetical protein